MNELTCLIFSKDRAAQLYALLESIESRYVGNISDLNLTVIYKYSGLEYTQAYDVVKDKFRYVNFILEKNLGVEVKTCLLNTKYIGLFCDDSLMLHNFDVSSIIRLLETNQDAIGFSLRLGKNITYCYPFNKDQKQPKFEEGWGILKFDWTNEEYDWGYPLEDSSSIYRSIDILSMIPRSFHANQLEAILYENRYKLVKPSLLCYETSAFFNAPLNVVNNGIDTNRRGAELNYSIENMNKTFSYGKKIDISVLNRFMPKGCHEEIEIRWINR